MEAYFGGLRVGGSAALSVGEDQRALFTELVSSNLNLSKLGFARIGFGALVATNDDSTTATTADQFFQSGGNAALYLSVPLMYRFVVYEEGAEPRLARRYDLLGTLTVGTDLPALNAAADEFAVVVQAGPELQVVQNATDDAIRLFAQASGGVNWGSDDFFNNLQVGEERGWAGFFASAKLTAGIDLNNLIRVGVAKGWSSVGGLSRPAQIVVQLIPRSTPGSR